MDKSEYTTAQAAADLEFVAKLSSHDALAWADTKMKAVESYYTSLNSLRNTLIPIFKLPNDVLVEIMWLLAQPPERPRKRSFKSWIRITHVCRPWRSIALSQPKLWSFIDLSHLPSARLFLERSQDHPIELLTSWTKRRGEVAQKTHEWWKTILDVVMGHIERATCIDVVLCQESTTTLLEYLSEASMPHLRALHIAKSDREAKLRDVSTLFSPSNDLKPPCLISVDLDLVHISWTSSFYHNLVHLKLRHRGDEWPSVEVILDILKLCPQLQTLDLRSAGDGERVTDPESIAAQLPVDPIHLSQLQYLYLDNSAVDITQILAHIHIPHTCKVILRNKIFENGTFLPKPVSKILKSLETCSISLNLRTEKFRRSRLAEAQPAGLRFEIIAPPADLFGALFAAIKGSELKIRLLKFQRIAAVDFTTEQWSMLLAELDRLTYLGFGQPISPLGILEALTSSACGFLKELTFQGMILDAPVSEQLVECVRYRAENGLKLRKLWLCDVQEISDDLRETLTSLVDTLNMDITMEV